MYPSNRHSIDTFSKTYPMGRRGSLARGTRRFCSLDGRGAGDQPGACSSGGCQRAQATRDQFIVSVGKKMAMGLSAFREVLRQALGERRKPGAQ